MLAFLANKATPFLTKPHTSISASCRLRRARTTPRLNEPRTQTIVCSQAKPKSKSTSSVDYLLAAGLGVVVLKRGKARLFRDLRNSLVYGGAVERCIPPPGRIIQSCDAVAVVDGAMECLGYGFYNESSMFRVRLLRHGRVVLPWDYGKDIQDKVEEAVQLRAMLGLPCEDTDVYRVVNGEGDRLSGLVVDKIGECVVVSSSAMWCERYKREIVDGLNGALQGCEVIWRRNVERLRQDGLGAEAKNDEEQEEEEDESKVRIVTERGVRYGVSQYALTRGQKTGHYADHRENRGYLREIVSRGKAKRVLDLFCYSGGFGLNAALGGASVTAVDSSGVAVEMGRANARLNGVEELMEVVEEDVMEFLRRCEELYDVVVVDPPKYAPTKGALVKATRKYRRLNELALKRVRDGGLLISCSCSGAVARERGLFVDIIKEAARAAGREVVLVKMSGAAADHVVAVEMMENEYLSVGVFFVR